MVVDMSGVGSRYRDIIFSDWLINVTDREIAVYEESSGNIYLFEPHDDEVLPDKPEEQPRIIVHYVVDEIVAERLFRLGRSLDDIAIVRHVSEGRGGYPIASLVWGRDPHKRVELRYDPRKFLSM